MKKLVKVLLCIFFPIGIVYCVGVNLFAGKGVASFLGGILLFGCGMLLCAYLITPEWFSNAYQTVLTFIQKFIS